MFELFTGFKAATVKYLALFIGGLAAMLSAWRVASNSGRAAEKAKNDKAKIDALNDQLDMQREGQDIDTRNLGLDDLMARIKAARGERL